MILNCDFIYWRGGMSRMGRKDVDGVRYGK